jgi:hypothetical protein
VTALPKWRESTEFRAFVTAFGRLLSLHKPSQLDDKHVIRMLMDLSSGLTGKVTTLLAQAAELAIRQKTECISAELIELAGESGTRQCYPRDSHRCRRGN